MTRRKVKSLILTLVGILLAGFWLYALWGGGTILAKTPQKLGGDIHAVIQEGLSAEDNAVRRFVEYAHRTVKVRSLEIVRCEVTTADGAGAVNADLSNIKAVEVVIRAVWDGWFARGGETEVLYTLVPRDGILHPTPFRIIRTTANYTRSECRQSPKPTHEDRQP